MKYMFLAGSFFFGITGICQAMDIMINEGVKAMHTMPVTIDLHPITIYFYPAPGFIHILLLSLGFFSLFLIWKKLKALNIGWIWEYIPD
ncbi:hypothetical protein [Desulfobacula sp.]|uniref:hypothetical protein n=1 Tax=Desulfobacula sp. TaxID=2593537 RepID=UPI00262B2365|nr:hypothetical protein [Desulfobacula sp.]